MPLPVIVKELVRLNEKAACQWGRGYEGRRMSAKVGADWVVVPSIVNNQENGTLFRAVEFTGAGYTINIPIYINRVLVDTITVTTK